MSRSFYVKSDNCKYEVALKRHLKVHSSRIIERETVSIPSETKEVYSMDSPIFETGLKRSLRVQGYQTFHAEKEIVPMK